MIPTAMPVRRSNLLAGGATALSLAALAYAPAADAQSYNDRAFQGDSTVVSGTVSIARTPTVDTLTIGSAQAVIDWNPETGNGVLPAGPIDFLRAGTTANFINGVSTSNYIVLNRVLPSNATRAISINGTVNSQLFTPGLGTVTGGSVWFYTPGGIIVGSTATFNVGNLVLTAADIATPFGLIDAGNRIMFRGAAGATGAITVQPGAKINLPATNSYLALVAPAITMGGTATVNGSVVYVAAEAVDVRILGGLFDIAFVTGTTVTNALTHTGTTTSPAGSFSGQTMVIAAMPKNNALTVLLGGTIGYVPAATATVDNGAVILSAGFDIGQDPFNPGVTIFEGAGAPNADIVINGGAFTSSVTARASLAVSVLPTSALSFAGDATLTGDTSATIDIRDGRAVTVGRNLRLNAGLGGQGGIATLSATTSNGFASSLTVAGQTYVNANGQGAQGSFIPGDAGTGGTASVVIDGSRMTLGSLFVSADGIGGEGGGPGAAATGGDASITVRNASVQGTGLSATDVHVTAYAQAGEFGYGAGTDFAGGLASGGVAGVTVSNAAFDAISLLVESSAFATGGGISGANGDAFGGTSSLFADNGRITASAITIGSSASGGDGGLGGARTAGAVDFDARNGARVSTTTGDLLLLAAASGGNGDTAGVGIGGTIDVTIADANVSAGNVFRADATGTVGSSTGSNAGAEGRGGAIRLDIGQANGALPAVLNATRSIELIARGEGISGQGAPLGTGTGGLSHGGMIDVTVTGGTVSGPLLTLDAGAQGTEVVSNAATASIGGAAVGGRAALTLDGGAFALGNLFIDASAQGGLGLGGQAAGNPFATPRLSSNGGDGTGGTATLDYRSGSLGVTNAIEVTARGSGGQSASTAGADGGNGGNATGGTATLTTTGGTIDLTDIELLADAFGGQGGSVSFGNGDVRGFASGGMGGAATGGTASATVTESFVDLNLFSMSVAARGGEGGFGYPNGRNIEGGLARADGAVYTPTTGGSGGVARAGMATLSLSIDESRITEISMLASAIGGEGQVGESGGRGADATGGTLDLNILDRQFGTSNITMDASARGGTGSDGAALGTGGAGGDAQGGTVRVTAAGPNTRIDFADGKGAYQFRSGATGGFGGHGGNGVEVTDGGAGGDAFGGVVRFAATDSARMFFGSDLTLGTDVDAVGGDGGGGGTGRSAGGAGGRGGDGTGGTLVFAAAADGVLDYDNAPSFGVDGNGGNGGAGGAGANGRFGATGAIGSAGGNGTDGGTGGGGGTAGTGSGGGFTVESASGGQVSFVALTVGASGTGGGEGIGGDGGRGGNGGAGGIGVAGAAGANGGQGGTGGDAGGGGQAGSNGSAGSGFGGFVTVTANGGAVDMSAIEVVASGSVRPPIGAVGAGGAGGFGGSGGAGGAAGTPVGNSPVPGVVGQQGQDAGIGGDGFAPFLADAVGGSIVLEALTDGAGTGGDIRIGLDGPLRSTGLTTGARVLGGEPLGNQGSITLRSVGNGTGQSFRLGDLSAAVGGNGSAYGGSVLLEAFDATLDLGADATIVSDGNIAIEARNAGGIVGIGLMSFDSQSSLSASHLSRPAGSATVSAGTIDWIATDLIEAPDVLLKATGSIFLEARVGQIYAGNLAAVDAVKLTATSGSVDVDVVGETPSGTPNTLTVATGGAASIGTLASARAIDISSADIVIAAGARLGLAGTTQTLTLTNTGKTQTIIGGSGSGGGVWRLDGAEAARLFAGNITVTAPTVVPAVVQGLLGSSRQPDVILDAFTLSGTAGNLAPTGTLRITTPGKMRIVGNVALDNMASGNVLDLAAGEAIEVLPQASIAINGAAGLTGTLRMTSQDIFAGSSAALAAVANGATIGAQTDRLGANDGSGNDAGYFSAGAIVARITGTGIYIQNSGAATAANTDYANRRGFTVGSGGFRVEQAIDNPVRVVVNGRQVSASGGFVTGLDLIPNIVLAPAAGTQTGNAFDPGSSVNGCVIAQVKSCGIAPPPPPPPPPSPPPTDRYFDPGTDVARDLIESETNRDGQGGDGLPLPTTLVEFKDFTGFIDQPLIDEPVTGAGNDDLYSLDDNRTCDPATETCPKP